MDGFLGHGDSYNIHIDWDLEHDTKNSGHNALKEVGLWKPLVTWVACHNAVYGSKMSPGRFQQIGQTFEEYQAIIACMRRTLTIDNGSGRTYIDDA